MVARRSICVPSTITGLPGAPEVHAGSTKVLATKGSGKTPAVYTVVASAVAFMGTQAAAASRVLLLLDDGGGRGGAGHRLAALRAPGFCHCLHGATAGMGVSATETGDAVRGGGVDGSNDARAPLLVELAGAASC